MSPVLRVGLVLPCVVLGAGVSLCAVALHGYAWGIVLSLATTAAVLVALPGTWWARLPFALGWVGLLVMVTPERPEGDYLVGGNWSGYLLLGAGLAVFGAGIAVLLPPRRAGEDSGGAGTAP